MSSTSYSLKRTSAPEASKRIADETRRLFCDLFNSQTTEFNLSQFQRPNYKLIEQIVRKLITETGLLRDVYNANDFESQATNKPNLTADKLKLRRVQFVQKLINFVANNEQPVVGCVAAKLVSGLEPTKCNELLQALARLGHKRVSGQQQQRGSLTTGSATVRQRTFTRASAAPPPQTSQRQVRATGANRTSAVESTSRRESALNRAPSATLQSASRKSSGGLEKSDSLDPLASAAVVSDDSQLVNYQSVPATTSTKMTAAPKLNVPATTLTVAPKSAQEELKSFQNTLANVVDLGEAIRANLRLVDVSSI